MRRCAKCEYENSDDAGVCARCSRPLAQPVTAAAETALRTPDWLGAMSSPAADTSAATSPRATGALADAAALPVQVRRSRVPVLSVDARRVGGAATAVQELPDAPAIAAGQDDAPANITAGKRRASALPLVILIIALAILVFLVLHVVF